MTLFVDEAGNRFVVGVVGDMTERKRPSDERERLIEKLKVAPAEVRTLQQFLPIGSYRKKVRDDRIYWTQIGSSIIDHTGAQFGHGICPECYAIVVADHAGSSPVPKPVD